jgi:lipopolysaccharide export LptBFGC system permease protein LptF
VNRRDRYVLREFLGPFLCGLLLATSLIEVLQVQRQLSVAGASRPPIGDILTGALWTLPQVATMALPVAVALGVSLAVNRLARDHEATVLRCTGIGLARLFLPLTVAGLVLAGVNVVATETWVPLLARRGPTANSWGNGFVAGAGVLPDTRTRVLVAYAGVQADPGQAPRLSGVAVVLPKQIVTATSATLVPGVLSASDAKVHDYNTEGTTVREDRFTAWETKANLDMVRPTGFTVGSGTQESFAEWTRRAKAASAQGDRARFLAAETARWFKIALPTLCAAFALCAAPLALRFSRAGGFGGVLLSVVTVFVAWNTHLFFQAVSLGGWIPPVVCAFTTHALLTVVGLVLLWRLER